MLFSDCTTPDESLAAAPAPRASLLDAAAHEIGTLWLLSKSNADAVVMPAILIALGAAWCHVRTVTVCAVCVAHVLAHTVLAVLFYDFGGQITGVEEDKRNRPERPIASGRLPLPKAWAMYAATTVLFVLHAHLAGVLPWSLAWMMLCIGANHGGLSRDHLGVMKNLVAGVGLVVNMCASFSLVAPLAPEMAACLAVMGAAFTVALPIQDLRDVEGDLTTGRRTLPIVLGDTRARVAVIGLLGAALVVWLGGLALVPGFAAAVWRHPELLAAVAPSCLLLAHCAIRVWRERSNAGDRRTYRLYVLFLLLAWLPVLRFEQIRAGL
jgi:4-hydroxybenzoate polyprenyltransferase